ncbi:MAG: tRNA (adenosine(37)-N6)-threonylcarbamoyltransferase complex dimerization subunit type 1 TsaB [Candidatus Omnitrophota bacterium]|nr:tRNA (adenosine(37)-N6)-threonylcarbamoyltransferase complex dimerization subunit type 1 TsaB [Candidatus Omnitrophota bacterium]
MLVLAIDTSSSRLSIAIRDKDRLLAERGYFSANKCSSVLLPRIKELLEELNLTLTDIQGFVVGLGPGSFTGLRIGVSVIKALAFALSKPVVGIPTLDILAENVVLADTRICPVMDAKGGEVYSCIYKFDGKRIKRLSKYLILPPRDLLKMLKSKTIFLGEGLFKYKELIEKLNKRLSLFASEGDWFPKAAVAARLGLDRLLAGKPDNRYKLTPLYLRHPVKLK